MLPLLLPLLLSAAPVLALTPERGHCSTADIALVRSRVAHPVYFCNFYASRGRVHSPLDGIDTQRVLNACECIKERSGPPHKPSTLPAPTGKGYGQGGMCYKSDIDCLRKEFSDPLPFCHFYSQWSAKEDPKTPIAGLTSARTLNACQCLLSSPQICQSAPARSLLKDPAATPFCLSVLKIPTATATEYISSYETVPSTIVDYATVPVTKVHEEVKTTEIAHTVTNYIANVTTKCGVNTKRIKRGASTTAKVPKYMSSEPAAYRSKACKCVTDLVAPTTTITSTIIATQNVISTIIDPILITVDVTSVSTQDATTTITVNATSTVDGGTAVTDDTTTVNSNDYDLYEETAPVNISTNALANCPCSASGGDKCDGYGGTPAFSCAGLKDCLKICGYINSHMGTTTCFSAVYESDTGTCTFVSETYFDSASSCAFINAVNYTIGVLET